MVRKQNRKTSVLHSLLKGLMITTMMVTGIFGTQPLANRLGLEDWPGKVNVASAAAASEWTQEAHDAQRTGFTLEEPQEPWSLAWTWNGPDANGGTGGHSYDAPRDAHTVTGGN